MPKNFIPSPPSPLKKHPAREAAVWLALGGALAGVMLLCVCVGSVALPLKDTITVLWNALWGLEQPAGTNANIILNVRLPRVLNAALCGAALSLGGAAMQGLLRNPLADGSTMGVSSGAALGAAVAMMLGVTLPGSRYGAAMIFAMAMALASLLLILALAYALDRSLATNSIILIGVIYSMFVSSLLSLLISFSGEKLRSITFWTMGSFSGTNYEHAGLLALALAVFGGIILGKSRELNAFAIGEENARHVGVPVRRVKLMLLAAVSALIGVSVSIAGAIGFVGLVTPHMTRMLVGPNHRTLLPACLFSGAIFLLLCDLAARTLLRPIELNVGVVTSMIGAMAFVLIFYRTRKGGGRRC